MNNLISVGKILNFHGIQGEAKVGFSKNQQDFLKTLKKVFVKVGEEYIEFGVNSVRFNKTFALMKFKDIDSIEKLIPYKGCLIFVEEQTIREKLEEDEFLIDELVGMKVFDEADVELAVVVGVSNNGASDLITVKSPSKKISMIPFVKELVLSVSVKSKKIVVNNISGLIEQ